MVMFFIYWYRELGKKTSFWGVNVERSAFDIGHFEKIYIKQTDPVFNIERTKHLLSHLHYASCTELQKYISCLV